MSGWFRKRVRQLAAMVYLASGLTLFVLLYLWTVLEQSAFSIQIDPSQTREKLFSVAHHGVYQLDNGLVAQLHDGALGHVFSRQELSWLQAMSFLSDALVWAVIACSVMTFKSPSVRRYGLLMAFFGVLLIYSPALSYRPDSNVSPWWALFHIAVIVAAVYAESAKQKVSQSMCATLIAYASQTGSAKRLAERLHQAVPSLADVCCVSQLSAQQLQGYKRVFFVVSTQGQGQAPDSAQRLLKELQQVQTIAANTQFSVLALGDRTYQTFCAFGYQLSDLLHEKGFRRVLPTQAVDRLDLNAVDSWWQQVCQLLGLSGYTNIELQYDEFSVISNECLNPFQESRLVHHIRLYGAGAKYQPGDLLAILPIPSPDRLRQRLQGIGWSGLEPVVYHSKTTSLLTALSHLDWQDEQADTPQGLVERLNPIQERVYSIASSEEQYVDLLVRQYWRQDGTLGLASGYLTALELGQQIKASIREHNGFHLVNDVPLIMIAAGTGLAPFMGFLQHLQRQGSVNETWLLFGEQYEDQDAYFSEQLQAYQASGILTRYDCAWSRSDGIYMPKLLEQHSDILQQWVMSRGAHIYLCGSRQGFGEAVQNTLQHLLGSDLLQARLHLDVY